LIDCLLAAGCANEAITFLGFSVLVPTPSRPVLFVSTNGCKRGYTAFDAAVMELRRKAA
jgi:hypothetical protein